MPLGGNFGSFLANGWVHFFLPGAVENEFPVNQALLSHGGRVLSHAPLINREENSTTPPFSHWPHP